MMALAELTFSSVPVLSGSSYVLGLSSRPSLTDHVSTSSADLSTVPAACHTHHPMWQISQNSWTLSETDHRQIKNNS